MKLFSGKTKSVELWVVWDDECNVVADMDRDDARLRLETEHGPVAREMKLTLQMPLPQPIQADMKVTDETETATIKINK